jgi:propionyl-CoA synthetase
VGHSYIVYAPLLHGCSSVLYEGQPVGTPDAGAFWRVIQEYKVKTLFVAPTAFRAIKQADPKAEFPQKYDLSSLKSVFLAGEHSDPDTLYYCERALEKYGDVKYAIDHWWQTELG